MKIHLYAQNLLLGLIILYFAQGSFYASGSMISQGALAVILSIAIIYLWKTLLLKDQKNILYKIWTVLVGLNLIGFLLTGDLHNSHHFGMLKRVSVALLSFYPFYYFASRRLLRRPHLLTFFILMLLVSIFSFYNNQTQILLERSSSSENIVNNVAYNFASLMPFVFLFKQKRILAAISIMILLFYIVIGSKRGALLTGGIGFIIYGYYLFKNTEGKYRFLNYIIGFITVGFIGYLAYQQLSANEFFMGRLGSTGQRTEVRDINFASLWQAWLNSDSYFNLFFGYGFAASLSIGATGNFAHNDWLELLSNFGLVGVILYITLFMVALQMIYKNKWNGEKKYLMLCILATWFLPTLFSMGIYTETFVLTVVPLTYLIAPKTHSNCSAV